MAKKSGTLGRIASKTLAAGREHVGKLISGTETVAQAAGAAVEDLLSGSKAKSTKKTRAKKVSAKKPARSRKTIPRKHPATAKKSKNK
jgi:hypothetical protein